MLLQQIPIKYRSLVERERGIARRRKGRKRGRKTENECTFGRYHGIRHECIRSPTSASHTHIV